jgi:hypothetical protein
MAWEFPFPNPESRLAGESGTELSQKGQIPLGDPLGVDVGCEAVHPHRRIPQLLIGERRGQYACDPLPSLGLQGVKFLEEGVEV